MKRQGKKATRHPRSIFLKPHTRWRIRIYGGSERLREGARLSRRRSLKRSADAALSVGWLRQVLYNILGLIKSSAQLRQAEQEAADCRAEAAARKERRRFAEALTLFYMLKLMERNKCCHHSFSPLCVRYMQTRTNVHARTLPLALPNVTFFSLSLSVSSSAIGGLCHI